MLSKKSLQNGGKQKVQLSFIVFKQLVNKTTTALAVIRDERWGNW